MAVIFRVSHQATSGGGTTYPIEYGAGLGSSVNMSVASARMGAKNGVNTWNWEHRTTDGWNGRNYMRFYRWEDVNGDPQTGFTWAMATTAPSGG